MLGKILFIFFLSLLFNSNSVYAKNNQFLTIVNPVRVSTYNPNPKLSLEAQYQQIKVRNLKATWLVTNDVLEREDLTRTFKSMDKNQELGIFMEISENFAREAGVDYNKTDSWHRSTSIFLSGYSQEDRKKLINTVFLNFKEKFGFFPNSVGAWWIDAYSLEYMQNKYKITANLTVSDQFLTDGYQVWGQYWSVPFYPNKYHAAAPANSLENKLDIVTFQWAHRDPLNGYISPKAGRASTYSAQDYVTLGLGDDYFKSLINLYGLKNQNKFGQVTFGLEGDLPADTYAKEYAHQLDIIKGVLNMGQIEVANMSEFALWYKDSFKNLSPEHLLETDDLLGGPNKVFWYQTPKYRINIKHNKKALQTEILDLRVYFSDFQEPFYLTPNKQNDLFSNLPFVIDSNFEPEKKIKLTLGRFEKIEKSETDIKLIFEKGFIELLENKINFQLTVQNELNFLKDSDYLDIATNNQITSVVPRNNFIVSNSGYTFKDITPKIPYSIKLRLTNHPLRYLTIFTFGFGLGMFIFLKFKKITLSLIVLVGIGLIIWQSRQSYFVSQEEVSALEFLSKQEKGNILVPDKDCLSCKWDTKYKLGVLSNRREYVNKFGKKPFKYNLSFFNSLDVNKSKAILRDNEIRYIYLVKYNDFAENLPQKGEDLNLEKIFENANAQIWKVKKT